MGILDQVKQPILRWRQAGKARGKQPNAPSTPALGLHFSSSRMAIAWLLPALAKTHNPQLRDCNTQPFAQALSADKTASCINALLQTPYFVGRPPRCYISLSPDLYRLLRIDNPKVDNERRYAAVKWLIKNAIDFPLQNCVYDLTEAPTPPLQKEEKKQIFVAASPLDQLQHLVRPLQKRRLQIHCILPSPLSVAALVPFLPHARFSLILYIEKPFSILCLFYEQQLYLYRQIPLPAQDDTRKKWTQSILTTYQYYCQHVGDPHSKKNSPLPFYFLPHDYQEDMALCDHLNTQLPHPCHAIDWGDILHMKKQEDNFCLLPPSKPLLGQCSLAICAGLLQKGLVEIPHNKNSKETAETKTN